MLTTIRHAVSRRRARLATHRRRAAARRRLAGEPLENRLLLSGDSWVASTELPPFQLERYVAVDDERGIYVATRQDGETATASDIWVRKYSANGDIRWTLDFQLPEWQHVFDIAVANGGVYICGSFEGTMNLGLGSDSGGQLVSAGELDGFLAKFRSDDGSFVWAHQWGGTEYDVLHGIAILGDGVFVTGQVSTPLNPNESQSNMLVAKLTEEGTVVWESIFEKSAGRSIDVSASSSTVSIYIGGHHWEQFQSPRYFVKKFSETGDVTPLAVDWTIDLDPEVVKTSIAVGTDEIDGVEEPCVYATQQYLDHLTAELLKISQDGDLLWSTSMTSTAFVRLDGVAVDGTTAYLSGRYEQQATFDVSPSPTSLISRGIRDGFLGRYDTTDGRMVAVQRMGGSGSDYAYDVAARDNRTYVVGASRSLDSDYPAGRPGDLSAFVPATYPPGDIFVMQLDILAPIVNIAEPTITVREGEPVTLNATTSAGTIVWYESGVPLEVDDEGRVTLDVGTHLISAIATDDQGRVGMAGVVVNVINSETYASTDTPKPMADAHPSKGAGLTTSQITVPSGTAITAIGTLKVDLSIAHSAPSQLQAVLAAPDGTQETLFNRPSALQATYETTAFVGKSLAGTWTRRLYDHVRGTTGTLNSWSITASPMVVENRPPVAADDSYTTPFATLLEVPAPGVLGNDSDPDSDPLTVEVVEGPASGELVWSGDGSFTFAPVADFEGTVTFTYVAFDSSGLQSNEAAVTITVAPPLGDERTFDSIDVPKTIVDPHPVQGARDTISQLVVANTSASIGSEFRLNLNISHASPTQLSAKLRSPVGTEAVVFPQGTASLPTEWTTNAFLGQPLDGTWQLILRDHVKGTTGRLNAWSITVAPAVGGTAMTTLDSGDGESALMVAGMLTSDTTSVTTTESAATREAANEPVTARDVEYALDDSLPVGMDQSIATQPVDEFMTLVGRHRFVADQALEELLKDLPW